MVPFIDNRADIIRKVLARDRFVNIGILPDVSDQFEEYCSLSLRYVKQVSRKTKDPRLEKFQSKILISESKRY